MSFAVLIGSVVAVASLFPAGDGSCLRAPVDAPIAARFEAPACAYCAGRRTIDFAARVGTNVTAPIAGTVTFAGVVAGSTYVTIAPTSSRSSYLVTLGDVQAASNITSGTEVDVGERIGVVISSPVRLSLRRIVVGGPAEYLDPEPSLVRWRAPIRLIPDPTESHSPPRVVRRAQFCRRAL